MELVWLLTFAFFGNLVCWVIIGLLLNLEFFVAKVKADVDYDVFISYRVVSDGGLAQDLYRKLKQEGLRVYLDRECLKDGEDFEAGFIKGLAKSNVYVLLFSLKGMGRIGALTPESACDNVLLEMRMARELHERRKEQFKVYPLLLGRYERDGRFDEFNFREKGETAWAQTGCDAVEAKVSQKLQEMGWGLDVLTPDSIKDNIDWFLKFQGLVTRDIEYDRVLETAAKKIAKIA